MREGYKLLRETAVDGSIYLKMMVKWSLLAAVAGVVCGLLGTLFHYCVDFATEMNHAHGWLLFLLPVSGVVIVFLYHRCGVYQDEGTNRVILSLRSTKDVPANMTFLIFAGTVLTHLCGGSSGREGAALQIGGSMGYLLGRIFHLDQNEKRIITMCGMSALFSALFGTPLAAAVFSIEVVTVGVMNYMALLPCVISSTIAYAIAGTCGITPMAFTITEIPSLSVVSVLQVFAVTLAASLLAALFVKGLHFYSHILGEHVQSAYLRVVIGGLLIIALTLLCRTRDYNGAGTAVIELSFTGQVVWYACLLKLLFTVITMGSGFKGGEIIPSFFIGATMGNVLGSLIGMPASFGAAIGMISVFCCVVNCPIASMIISIELFGSGGLIYFALACALGYLVSGYFSLYSTQRFVHSKTPMHHTDERDYSKDAEAWRKE